MHRARSEALTPAMNAVPHRVLPVLVLAQLAGTSMWFAVNAVMPDLQRSFGWPATAVGTLTSALQFGFILGTLVFALLAIADRFRAPRVFLVCAMAGAASTVGAWAMVDHFEALLAWRFASGFFLAGIYPVGMKIAAQWYRDGLGATLGYLIGALVLGSASAHGLRALADTLPWPSIMLGVAALVYQTPSSAQGRRRRWQTPRRGWLGGRGAGGGAWGGIGLNGPDGGV